MRRSLPLLTLFLGTSIVHAQGDSQGAFFGVTYGNLDFEVFDDFDEEVISETGDHVRLLGGYRVNDNFAFEAGWADTSGIDYSFSGMLPCCGNVNESVSIDIETLTLRAVGIIPFDRISLFGALGYYDASFSGTYRYSDDFESVSVTASEVLDDSGAMLAAGLQIDFDSGLSLRGEVEWFDTPSDVDALAVNFGVVYYVGRR